MGLKMKTVYVSPKIQVFSFNACGGILMASNNIERYTFCPYIPETRCQLYHDYIKCKIGKGKLSEQEKDIQEEIPCPYRNSCEDYDLFYKITNGKMR